MSEKKSSNAAVIRVHKNKNYTVMSNRHLFDKPPLSLKAKGLLCILLALPEKWNYSINGLVAICKESRACLKSTLNELKKDGYLKIEKINGENGCFKYIYHIFEEKQKTISPEVGFPPLVNPPLVNPSLENRIQLNTNKVNTKKLNTNKETLVKTSSVFTPECLFNLYKKICISFPKPQKLTPERIKKADKRLEKNPGREYWEKVFKKAESSEFCLSGSWFNFDWILKNDGNSLKVFEGNYDNKTPAKENKKTNENLQKQLLEEAKHITNREDAINFVYNHISGELKSTYTSGTRINLGSYDWIVFLGEKFQFNRQVIYDRLYEELDREGV